MMAMSKANVIYHNLKVGDRTELWGWKNGTRFFVRIQEGC